jgi:regulator of extracellular matrix RemA (YlzA/DUF370 family)
MPKMMVYQRGLMPKFVRVGGRDKKINLMAADKAVAIISPNSAPAKRLKDEARESGRLVDMTLGGKTRSFIITTANQVFLSSFTVATLVKRCQEEDGPGQPPEEPDSP